MVVRKNGQEMADRTESTISCRLSESTCVCGESTCVCVCGYVCGYVCKNCICVSVVSVYVCVLEREGGREREKERAPKV